MGLWLAATSQVELELGEGKDPRLVPVSELSDVAAADVPAVLEAMCSSLVRFREDLKQSSDAVVVFTAQFMDLAEAHVLYMESTASKDSLARESLMPELMAYWANGKKHKYVDAGALTLETNYGSMTPLQLQEYRVNRDSRFNEGKGAVAMDELIEDVNDWDKTMEESRDDSTHIMKSQFLTLFRRALSTMKSMHGKGVGVHKSSTDGSSKNERRVVEKLLKASKCLVPSSRVADDLKDAWWAHVPDVKQVPAAGDVLSPEDAAVDSLFSQQFERREEDDEEGDEEEEIQEETEEAVLTQGQADRQLRAKKWLPDTRALGNWLEKGAKVTGGLKEKRAAKVMKAKRHFDQIEEAYARNDAKKRRAFGEVPPVQPQPAWRDMLAAAFQHNTNADAAASSSS